MRPYSPRASSKNAPTAVAIASLTAGIQMWCVANAQNPMPGFSAPGFSSAAFGSNFASRLADSIPMAGFTGTPPLQGDLVPGVDQDSGQGYKGAFLYEAGISSVYYSNFNLSENDPEGELSTGLAGTVTYLSDPEGGAPVSIFANYSPVAQTYLENPDNNGIDQSGNFKMTMTGAKTVVSGYANLSQISGTDPILGEFVTESFLSAGIDGNYQIAPRTSIAGSFALATSDFGSSSLEGSDVFSTYISGSWQATELFSFGPQVQYIKSMSDNSGTRDAWQLVMQAQYDVGERIQVSGSLGLDYSTNSREEGSGSAGLTGNFTASYSINERLSWSGSVEYVTVPSPSEVDYVINNLAISTSLGRKLLRANVDVGVSLNVASYEAVGPTAVPLEDDKIVDLFVSYSRNLFLDRVSLVSAVYYSLSDGQSSWDQFQLSLGLSTQF